MLCEGQAGQRRLEVFYMLHPRSVLKLNLINVKIPVLGLDIVEPI